MKIDRRLFPAALLAALVPVLLPLAAHAQDAMTISISVQSHQFRPTEIRGRANVPITLRIRNLDAGAMEFESVSLRVEKIVPANGEGTVRIRPLPPGRYEFFDDFHQSTRGALVIQ